jgi:hypothetical protein
MEVSSYQQDNARTGATQGDDTGLPESLIYSNFSKHLWRTHTRHGLVQSPNRSRENTDGPRSPSVETPPVKTTPRAITVSTNLFMKRSER